MTPRVLCDGRAALHVGDCLEALREMPSNSVDSVVTDPPYGLSDHKPADVVACLTAWLAGEEYRPKKNGFMGRAWDSWVPGPEVWREVFRVLKPGGHVVAFAGSRTHDLMRYLCRLVTPPGGVVLDPFTGSGSTGKAAMLEGFQFIGCELDQDEKGNPLGYSDIAEARIVHAWKEWCEGRRQGSLFDCVEAA